MAGLGDFVLGKMNLNSSGQIAFPVSERFLLQAIENPPNGLYVYDLERQSVIFLNRQFSKITGYSWDDVKLLNQASLLEQVQIQCRSYFQSHWEKILQASDHIELEIEYRLQTKSGDWIWVVSRDSVFERNSAGKVCKTFGVLNDITARKELEQSLGDKKKILDSAVIIVETDPQGVMTYVSDKFCEISKYSRNELIGRTHQFIKSGHHPQKFFEELWTEISSGRTWRGEIKNRAKDGSYFWSDTTIIPIFGWEGRINKYVAVRHAITKEKELQQDLLNQIEIAESALNSSNLKSGFISEMSHEVRNNLNLIAGYAELLNDGGDADNKEFISQIKKASDHTLRIMKDVLDALRLENRKPTLDLSPVNLRDFMTDMIELFHLIVERKKLSISIEMAEDLPEVVSCDQYRLSQIFLNLLTNATKFTDRGGIKVRVEKLQQKENGIANLLFSVEDTGRGIPKDKLKGLFNSFEQVLPVDSKFGSGLGLSICKKLVELMDGEIWAESNEKGTKFSFRLPLKEIL